MPTYFKGVGPGTYWHVNPPSAGFKAENPGVVHSVSRVMQHIVFGNTNSPYISMTSSYAVAVCFASNGPGGTAMPGNEGYVYEIEFPNQLPLGITLIEPVEHIVNGTKVPPELVEFHHDGGQDLLKGIIDYTNHGQCLINAPARPGRNPNISPPTVTDHLKCIVMAMRDAEILAMGVIPQALIIDKHSIP